LLAAKIVIWPDADDAGQKYAVEVAKIVQQVGCEVSIIDCKALASLTQDGGHREPKQGWDAADAVREWQDLPALREALWGSQSPMTLPPSQMIWKSTGWLVLIRLATNLSAEMLQKR
jgi:hypothetical protein